MDFKKDYPLNTRMRMKPDRVDGYKAELRNKVKDGRIGIVVAYAYPSGTPIILFPKDGRKKEYRITSVYIKDWEVVELGDGNA